MNKQIILSMIFSACLSVGFQRANSQIISTIAGNGSAGSTGMGGQATAAPIGTPYALLVVGGNLYIASDDEYVIRVVDLSTGIINPYAGTEGTHGSSGDGGAATAAELYRPDGLAYDGTNLLIGDRENSRVRAINMSTGVISTIAGTGTQGHAGDGGAATAAELVMPWGLSYDATHGNLLIADYTGYDVREINNTGVLNVVAGDTLEGFAGDGGQATASTCKLTGAIGVYVNPADGSFYIGDGGNHCIRYVNSSGYIYTFAGNGTPGFSGDGGLATAAELHSPRQPLMDASGNLYIADIGNNCVRKVNTSNIISTFAGQGGVAGHTGDGGQATAAKLNQPSSLAFDASGNLYIGDINNTVNNVRKVANAAPIWVNGGSQNLTVCENSAAVSLNTQLQIIDDWPDITETWSVTATPSHGTLSETSETGSYATPGTTLNPTGFTYTPTTGYTGTDVFTISVNDGYLTAYTTVNVKVVTAGTISGTASVCTGSTTS